MGMFGIPGRDVEDLTFAYFSMEFGIDPAMPTYSGGLGVLAGDTMRAAADLGLPMVGVTLLHRKGYFRQRLDKQGNQIESDAEWSPAQHMERLPLRVMVTISGRPVQVQAWRYQVKGESGHIVPVYFLDTGLAENSPWDQTITDHLYGGDRHYRLCQEVVLGLGGVMMLRVLGHQRIKAYHMNEGHSVFIALALLEERSWGQGLSAVTAEDREAVRQRCVFTTHTPVPAGHDEFSFDLVREVLGEERTRFLRSMEFCPNGTLNMTNLALNFSRYINGVSMRHEEVSRSMYTSYRIDSITNGVHAPTWVSPAFLELYDRYISEWRRDNNYLRYALRIPVEEIWRAHCQAKQELLAEVARLTGVKLDPDVMTIGFARRATAYKRSDLLFWDIKHLREIAQRAPLQVIYGGKAHPTDGMGKDVIRRVHAAASALAGKIPVVYLEEYGMALAKYLVGGVDLWLNTPQRPQEASGTSGMKAALNAVPSLSIVDGWWTEGHVEGVTGWAIGEGYQDNNSEKDAASLYDKLDKVILPMFYGNRNSYVSVMRSAVALNGSYFNAQRMVLQYMQNAYLRNSNG